MTALHIHFRDELPRLTSANYRETSPADWTYSCIAWAAGHKDAWWWPTPGRYWPAGVSREETVAAFVAALGTLGYKPDSNTEFQPDLDKIVLFAHGDVPTHAARLMSNGWWTSKLGHFVDIEHESPDAIAGGAYGEVVVVLSKPKSRDERTHGDSP